MLVGRRETEPPLDLTFHGIDDIVGGGGAGGEADRIVGEEPGRLEVVGGLDLMDAGAGLEAGGGEFAGIVAMAAADDDDDIGGRGQVFGGALALFGGQTDGVGPADVSGGKAEAHAVEEVAGAGEGLGGLGHHPETRPGGEKVHVGFVEDDVCVVEITDEAADLDMVPLADDHGVEAELDPMGEALVGDVDQGAGGFEDTMSELADLLDATGGGSMGGDEDGGGVQVGGVLGDADAFFLEAIEDGGIMDEVTEDGDGAGGGFLAGEEEGITDAEAHAEVGGADHPGLGLGAGFARERGGGGEGESVHRLCITEFGSRERLGGG